MQKKVESIMICVVRVIGIGIFFFGMRYMNNNYPETYPAIVNIVLLIALVGGLVIPFIQGFRGRE